MSRPFRLLALALFFSTVRAPSGHAAEEEVVLAVEPGFGALSLVGEDLRFGFQSSFSAWVGVTSSIWVAGSVGFSHPGTVEPDSSFEAVGGLVGALDVFQIVPFAEVMGGALWARDHTVATLRLGLGGDYHLTGGLWLGIVLRYRPLPEEIGSALTTCSLRLTYRFDL